MFCGLGALRPSACLQYPALKVLPRPPRGRPPPAVAVGARKYITRPLPPRQAKSAKNFRRRRRKGGPVSVRPGQGRFPSPKKVPGGGPFGPSLHIFASVRVVAPRAAMPVLPWLDKALSRWATPVSRALRQTTVGHEPTPFGSSAHTLPRPPAALARNRRRSPFSKRPRRRMRLLHHAQRNSPSCARPHAPRRGAS